MTPRHLLFALFPDFWQNRPIFKKRYKCLLDKKDKLFDLYLIVLLISFFFWRITGENRTKLKKKLFIWTTKSGETQHNKHTKCTKWLFISNFNNFNDVSDSGWFLHHFWLQEFIQKQTYEPAEKFFDTVNTQSSCDDFLKENRDTFIVMSSFFHLVYYSNIEFMS